MYLYESHLGGLYLSDEPIPYEELYCDQCGDSDIELGRVDTFEDVLACITDEDGFVPYFADYLKNIKAEMEAYAELKAQAEGE